MYSHTNWGPDGANRIISPSTTNAPGVPFATVVPPDEHTAVRHLRAGDGRPGPAAYCSQLKSLTGAGKPVGIRRCRATVSGERLAHAAGRDRLLTWATS